MVRLRQGLAVAGLLGLGLLPVDPGVRVLAAGPGSDGPLPTSWDVATRENVLWMAELGSESYAGPVVAGGKVFVGTNNDHPRDPEVSGDRGVLMAFDATTGDFLWQAVHDKLPEGRSVDWPLVGVCSTPTVVGDRLYYLSNRAELVALDTEGFRDGDNDGPFTAERRTGEGQADIVWTLDLRGELGVVPRFMVASSPRVVGDLLFVVTGNALAEDGTVPAPGAPSFLAVERATGKVRWADASPGRGLLDGAWASPAVGELAGRRQVLFPGADGWLYAFAPDSGELLWKFDTNQSADGEGKPRGRESLLATPWIDGDRVYLGVGHDPEWGPAEGRLWALEVGRGEVGMQARPLWSLGGEAFGRTLSSATLARDGEREILYAADLTGFLYALDPATGGLLWKYDAFAAVWASPLVADGKIYLADEDGDVAILAAGAEKRLLAELTVGGTVHTTPVASGGVLYLSTSSKLYALRQGAGSAGRQAPSQPGGPSPPPRPAGSGHATAVDQPSGGTR